MNTAVIIVNSKGVAVDAALWDLYRAGSSRPVTLAPIPAIIGHSRPLAVQPITSRVQ